jgi:hypothetical protein
VNEILWVWLPFICIALVIRLIFIRRSK